MSHHPFCKTLLLVLYALLAASAPLGRAADKTSSPAQDKVAQALAEVRNIRADLFSRHSSILGTLPGPEELAAHQARCRPDAPPRAALTCDLEFDADTLKHAAALDPMALRKAPSRMGMNVLPLGITGAYFKETQKHRELLIVHVLDDSPAAGRLRVDDIIIGANGRLFTDPEDPRPEMGNALCQSQSPQLGGILTLHVVRDRKPINVKIDLGNTLPYSPTWPFDCSKSQQILRDAVKLVMASYPWHRYNFWTPLFLMASGDEAAMELARRHLCKDLQDHYEPSTGASAWTGGYRLINLCEYYLLTGDSTVLPAIRHQAEGVAWAQYRSGSWSHGGGKGPNTPAPGTAGGGYGEVNNAGLGAFIGLCLARQCGIEPFDHTLPRAIRFFGKFCGSNLPYGLGSPGGRGGRMDNGMSGMAAIAFHLLGEEAMARRWARQVCYMWMGRERGHAEAIFSAAWGPASAHLAPGPEFHAFMNHMKWAYELGRARDGGLTFMRGSRWTYPNMTAAMALALCLPQQRLQILGSPTSVFAMTPPPGLEQAARLYKDKHWSALRRFLDDYLHRRPPSPAHREYANRLLDAYRRLEKHAAATLKIIEQNIAGKKLATARLQLDLLKRFLGEERPQAVRLRAMLTQGNLTDPPAQPSAPLVDARKIAQQLQLAKGGIRDGFAHSPHYIQQVNAAGFAGMPPEKIATFLAHFSGGVADGAALALARHGEQVVPLLQRLLADTHPGIRAGALNTLWLLYHDDGPDYRSEIPDALAHLIRQIRPLVNDPSPLVRSAVSRFILGLKVSNPNVYEIMYELARQGGAGVADFARYGVKDPSVRTRLNMLLTQTALRTHNPSPASYKPILVASTAHIEYCQPYLQTALDILADPVVLDLYGFFSNCPRDAALQILDHYASDPLVRRNLNTILQLSFRKGMGQANQYSIHSIEYPHRIVIRLGTDVLPQVEAFLEQKQQWLRHLDSGKLDRPLWMEKLPPQAIAQWHDDWQTTIKLVRCLDRNRPDRRSLACLCHHYLTGRNWGEWERSRIRDYLAKQGTAALPTWRALLADLSADLIGQAERTIAAVQARYESEKDRQKKRTLDKQVESLTLDKTILAERLAELEDLTTLIELCNLDKPTEQAVMAMGRFYVKRTWGTQHPHLAAETAWYRPLWSSQLSAIRRALMRWGPPAAGMLRRFLQADHKTLADDLAYLDQRQAFWKPQWSRKSAVPLARIAIERTHLPALRAELADLADLLELSGQAGPLAENQLARLCRIYTRHDWPAARKTIAGILRRHGPAARVVIQPHLRAEQQALAAIQAEMNNMLGKTVIDRVRIPYEQKKALAVTIRQGIEQLAAF